MPNLYLVSLPSFHPSVLPCTPSPLHHLIPPPRGRRGDTNLSATCFASCGWLLPVSSLMEFVAILSVRLPFPSILQFSVSSLYVCIVSRVSFSLSLPFRGQIGFWQGLAAKQRNERMSWLAFWRIMKVWWCVAYFRERPPGVVFKSKPLRWCCQF
jgi:hypothetical protein